MGDSLRFLSDRRVRRWLLSVVTLLAVANVVLLLSEPAWRHGQGATLSLVAALVLTAALGAAARRGRR
jgi:hypothetical protein